MTSLLLLVASACDKPSSQSRQKSQVTTDEFTSTPEQCERDIDNLLGALQPDRYGISSDRDITINMLNTWLTQCGAAEDFTTADNDAEVRARLLPEAVDAQTSLNQFTDVDAGYLRNSLLIQQLVDSTLTDEERTDVERAVALFYKVVRTVDLVRESPGAPPLGPLQSLLYGRGTSEIRAWIYGMMLRQLRLDTVIIRPRGDGAETDQSLLVGVIIPEEGVYLFDFHLGVPLASPTDDTQSPLPQMPATLAAARENDAIFRQYDLRGLSYPLTSEQVAEVEVLAVGSSSTWAPRFGKLQSALPVPVEVYDGLTANSLQEQGLIDRLVTAGQAGLWDEKDIGIWQYPDRTLFSLKSLNAEQIEMLNRQSFVLQSPIHVTQNPKTGQYDVLSLPERNLYQARISYIQGKTDSALAVYLQSRMSLPHPKTANRDASDWSAYWAALAQYEMEEFDVVVRSTEQYLENKESGAWNMATISLLANALAQEGKYDKAVNILEREPVRAPQHLGNQFLVRRWRRLAKGDSAIDPKLTSSDTKTETPETPEPQATENEPQDTEESPADEAPPNPDEPKETPSDLPPSDERPDSRFEDGPAEIPPPANQSTESSDTQDTEEESDTEDEPQDNSEKTDLPTDKESTDDE